MCEKKTAFGFGTTEINFKIQKELGTRFIGVAHHYLFFSFWSYKLLFQKVLGIGKPGRSKEFVFPEVLKAGGNEFALVKNVDDLDIPENGYWSSSNIDIECIRDKHFLRNRFFENFIEYKFYRLKREDKANHDECYFVVRPTVQNGILLLSVVDIRFNTDKSEQFKYIVIAVARLGRKLRLPLVSLRTTIPYGKISLFPSVIRTRSEEHIVTNYPVDAPSKIFITNADSDADYLNEDYYLIK